MIIKIRLNIFDKIKEKSHLEVVEIEKAGDSFLLCYDDLERLAYLYMRIQKEMVRRGILKEINLRIEEPDLEVLKMCD